LKDDAINTQESGQEALMKKFIRTAIICCSFSICFSNIAKADGDQYSKIFYEKNTSIYDAIYFLTITNGEALLSNKKPQSQAQLSNALKELDVERLDGLSLQTYYAIISHLYGNYLFHTNNLKFDVDLNLALQAKALLKTENAPRHDEFATYNSTPSPLSLAFNILVANYCFFYVDLPVQKNFAATKVSHTYTNLPFFQRDLDYHFPTRAGISFGGSFFNVSIARGPLNVGRSLSGSLLIADAADRLDYFNACIFLKNVSFDLNIIQLQHSRFVFMHEISFRILKKIAITLHEGLLVNSYFDPRYLNPFMIMHNHAPWYDPWQREDKMKNSDDIYTSCQLGITLDVVPIKNLRLYWQYGQNQVQTASEKKGGYNYVPSGIGTLFGGEWVQPTSQGYLVATLEGLYTLPWLFIGQNKYVSFTHYRKENVSSLKSYADSKIDIWLASPYGPDTAGFFARLGFVKINKWEVSFLYRFLAKGENEEHFFDPSKEIAPNVYYTFSSLAKVKHSDWATWSTPSGNPTYFNTLKASFFYQLINNFSLKGYLAWTVARGKRNGTAYDASISAEYAF